MYSYCKGKIKINYRCLTLCNLIILQFSHNLNYFFLDFFYQNLISNTQHYLAQPEKNYFSTTSASRQNSPSPSRSKLFQPVCPDFLRCSYHFWTAPSILDIEVASFCSCLECFWTHPIKMRMAPDSCKTPRCNQTHPHAPFRVFYRFSF